MLRRNLAPALRAALADRPVVLLHGARQTGKTTLAREIRAGAPYLTMDDAAAYAAAIGDPQGFIDGLRGPVVLDEVQRAPDLFRAIKRAVDADRTPGRFLLTGSANILLLPRIAESLAGRVDIVTLRPLSQGEIDGRSETFIDAAFASRPDFDAGKRPSIEAVWSRALRGGFPEVVASIAPSRRDAWFGSYLTAILQRDVRDIAAVEDLGALPRLLTLLASRTAGLLNYADLARGLSIPQSTLKRYFALLEALFLVRTAPPWSVNIGTRLVKTPKVYIADTGMVAHLLALSESRLERATGAAGALLETFIANELVKQTGWCKRRPEVLHFRTHAGHEVDIVLEDRGGEIVGIEVRAGASIGQDDFKGLRALAEAAGKRFVRGIVLYGGSEIVPFARNLIALPIQTLWHT